MYMALYLPINLALSVYTLLTDLKIVTILT